MRYELKMGEVHRPLDAETRSQAEKRGQSFARRFRTPNVREVSIIEIEDNGEFHVLMTFDPWSQPTRENS